MARRRRRTRWSASRCRRRRRSGGSPTATRSRRSWRQGGLQGRPPVRGRRHPDPVAAGRPDDHAGRRRPGHRGHRRHGAEQPAPGGDGREDPGHLLRPADPRQPERRLLRQLRQLQGRRRPGQRAAGRPRPAEQGRLARAPRTGPFNVELFAGSLDDNNAHFFFDGAMQSSSRSSTTGRWWSRAGQTTIEQVAILRWQQETAQKRMEDLLTSTYNDGTKVNGVLSPYDGLSRGIITALQNAGYGHGRQPDADRHRPGRGDRVGQAHQRRRPELDDLQGHPACWPSRP